MVKHILVDYPDSDMWGCHDTYATVIMRGHLKDIKKFISAEHPGEDIKVAMKELSDGKCLTIGYHNYMLVRPTKRYLVVEYTPGGGSSETFYDTIEEANMFFDNLTRNEKESVMNSSGELYDVLTGTTVRHLEVGRE